MCDDSNVCTTDSCDPDYGCVYDYMTCEANETCDFVLGCVPAKVHAETIILDEKNKE